MKEEILKIYRSLTWGDKIPSCCTEKKFFKCPECGEMCAILDLEIWSSDTDDAILNDEVVCSICYETEMGDDL